MKNFVFQGLAIVLVFILLIFLVRVDLIDFFDSERQYVGKSPFDCSTILFQCKNSEKYFSNEYGCGCQTINVPDVIACTEDAKICPDGSVVGRVAPNCEFAECPSVSCDYNSTDKKYVGFSQDECSRIKFLCVKGSEYFSDSCGCGCQYEEEPNRKYVSRDLEECKAVQFLCVEGRYPFFSSTGCGCEVRKEAPDKCICTLQYDPVCGFDGNTYGNSCQAACVGVETNYSGECVAKETLCTPDQRNVSGCTKELNPVCGWNDPEQIQCIKYPCAQNYDNPCLACANEQVISWTQGQCPVD